MKKTLLVISAFIFLFGCSQTSDIEEESELTVQDYYDIVISTIESESVGEISGSFLGAVLQGGRSHTTFYGEISRGNIKLFSKTYNIMIYEEESTSNIKNPDDELKSKTQGIVNIYNLNINDCEVNENLIFCNSQLIREYEEFNESTGTNKTLYDAERITYFFVFNNDNELKMIDIDYARAEKLSEVIDSETDDEWKVDINDRIEDYLKAPSHGALIGLTGGYLYGSETVIYE